jgi:hypothetical protein
MPLHEVLLYVQRSSGTPYQLVVVRQPPPDAQVGQVIAADGIRGVNLTYTST